MNPGDMKKSKTQRDLRPSTVEPEYEIDLFPFKPVEVLHTKRKNNSHLWSLDKKRKSLFDLLIEDHKKQNRVPPNQYFKTDSKTKLLNTKRMTQSTLFEDRGPTHRVPKGPRPSMVALAIREAKGRLAPNHYPV